MYYKKFDYLAGFDIQRKDTEKESATIYGNGLNMTAVIVKVKIMDKGTPENPSAPVEMTDSEMKNSIFLCDYQTGEKIPFDFESGVTSDWRVSFNKNNYLDDLENSLSRTDADPDLFPGDGYNYLTLYVYCTKGNINKKIAAGISIQTVGEFKTTSSGTNTMNGSTGSSFKMPSYIQIRAIEPYKYTLNDFSMNTDSSSLHYVDHGQVTLFNLTGTNYYLDIQKPSHKISTVTASKQSGSIFGSDYSWYWIWQAFDCAGDYGKSHLSKILTVTFGKYEFPCKHTINKKPGVCFPLIDGQCSVMTSWAFFGETYVDIIDNFGNRTSPVLRFNKKKEIEHIGFRNNSQDVSESTVRHVSNYGVPEDIIQHITDAAPDMICGVLSQDDNNSGFKPCVNASPAPEQGAIIDADFLRTLRHSHEITHVICSVPDARSHDISDYQAMSDRDGLPYLLVLWPSRQSLTIFPQTELDYENRPYIYGQYDCYSLIRDYFLREKGIALNDYPREVYSLSSGKNIFEVQAPEEGFVKIEDTSLQAGDILVFNLPSTRLQHSAVYIGNGQMLHHLPPGLSCREAYSEKWEKRTSSVWRHNNLIIK
ncbi:NlpC/P60 family protein [Morganella sp. GD04133]|uniref:NlpC/P60 family protein n=1 Tax=Morganella sp. GD04133 TaxID=2975435 RepID=UPI0024483A83|nr:NlpC/P60 family protein [Morganella sp. GD04133]MDH0357056.1 NlpC/P60 family protein [Morganella sp. GD04133]